MRGTYLLKVKLCTSPHQAGLSGQGGESSNNGLAARFISCLDKSWVLSRAQPSLASGQVGSQWINIQPIP